MALVKSSISKSFAILQRIDFRKNKKPSHDQSIEVSTTKLLNKTCPNNDASCRTAIQYEVQFFCINMLVNHQYQTQWHNGRCESFNAVTRLKSESLRSTHLS